MNGKLQPRPLPDVELMRRCHKLRQHRWCHLSLQHSSRRWSSTATTACAPYARSSSCMATAWSDYVADIFYTASATSSCWRTPTPTSCCALLVVGVPTPSPSSGSSVLPPRPPLDGELREWSQSFWPGQTSLRTTALAVVPLASQYPYTPHDQHKHQHKQHHLRLQSNQYCCRRLRAQPASSPQCLFNLLPTRTRRGTTSTCHRHGRCHRHCRGGL